MKRLSLSFLALTLSLFGCSAEMDLPTADNKIALPSEMLEQIHAFETVDSTQRKESLIPAMAGKEPKALLYQSGYVVGSEAEPNQHTGYSVGISKDGNVMVIGSMGYDGANGTKENMGAAYVFKKIQGFWNQICMLRAYNSDAGDEFGFSVSIDEDGKNIAIGAPSEGSNATGVNPGNFNPPPNWGWEGGYNNNASESGAVYLYRVARGTSCIFMNYIKASNTGGGDHFGTSVSLSRDGRDLVVGANKEDGNTNTKPDAGAAYLFQHPESGGGWSQQALLRPSALDEGDEFGSAVDLSGDGSKIAVSALGDDWWGDDFSDVGAVYIFDNSGEEVGAVRAFFRDTDDLYGVSVALDLDGSTLAVGASFESSSETGIIHGLSGGMNNNAEKAGAVYLYNDNGEYFWEQTDYVKASNTGSLDQFGRSVALNDAGTVLAVGAPGEASNATGINGNGSNNSTSMAGAIYVYKKSGSYWSQQAYVKTSTGPAQAPTYKLLGISVDLSEDLTLAGGTFFSEATYWWSNFLTNSQIGIKNPIAEE